MPGFFGIGIMGSLLSILEEIWFDFGPIPKSRSFLIPDLYRAEVRDTPPVFGI